MDLKNLIVFSLEMLSNKGNLEEILFLMISKTKHLNV